METLKTVVAVDGKVAGVRIPSGSRPGLTHKVLLSCTCEGFQFGGFCYHLAQAASIVREDARAQAARTRARVAR
jgi:hypothetical protein